MKGGTVLLYFVLFIKKAFRRNQAERLFAWSICKLCYCKILQNGVESS